MLPAMLSLLMIQLKSFSKLILVFVTAPLGGIGASCAARCVDCLGSNSGDDPAGAVGVLGTDGLSFGGGLIVATVLTLFFLPALYAARFRIGRAAPVVRAQPMRYPTLCLAGE
jgi:multidrug efflux pump